MPKCKICETEIEAPFSARPLAPQPYVLDDVCERCQGEMAAVREWTDSHWELIA